MNNNSSELIEVGKINLKEHSELSVAAPEVNVLTPFRDLKEDSIPLIPLPPDPCPDIFYPNTYVENKCVICNSLGGSELSMNTFLKAKKQTE